MKKFFLMSALLFCGSAFADSTCSDNAYRALERDSNQFRNSRFWTCDSYPADDSLEVMLYHTWVDGKDGERHLMLRVLLVKTETPEVVASGNLHIWEGPNIRVREGDYDPEAFTIDNTNYPLNESTNAFAIRADIAGDDYCSDIVRDQFVTLFVREGKTLKPVLKHLPLQQRYVVEGTACDRYGDKKTLHGQGQLSLADTETNGYRDLILSTETVTDVYDQSSMEDLSEGEMLEEESSGIETKVYKTTLKFDGHRYPVKWEELPAKEWWQL